MTISAKLKLNILMSLVVVLAVSWAFGLVLMTEREAAKWDIFGDKLIRGLSELNELTEYYLRHPEDRPKEQWRLRYNSLSKMLNGPIRIQEKTVLIKQMRQDLADMKALFDELAATYEEGNPGPAGLMPDGSLLHAKRQQLADLVVHRSRKISGAASVISEEGTARLEEVNRKSTLFFPMVAFVMVAVEVWSSVLIRRSIVSPINKLHTGTEIIGSGNLDHKVGTSAQDEIGDLSRAFDVMADKLRTVTVSKDKLLKEIEERRRVEEALQESQSQLQLALRASNAGAWNWDVAAGAITWSPEYYELYGLDPSMPPTTGTGWPP